MLSDDLTHRRKSKGLGSKQSHNHPYNPTVGTDSNQQSVLVMELVRL